jgi:hypothetical protein
MGLGIGKYCIVCGNQLYFDDDGAEIAELSFKDEEYIGETMCHACVVEIKRMKIALGN